jgi:hypothetical protein
MPPLSHSLAPGHDTQAISIALKGNQLALAHLMDRTAGGVDGINSPEGTNSTFKG